WHNGTSAMVVELERTVSDKARVSSRPRGFLGGVEPCACLFAEYREAASREHGAERTRVSVGYADPPASFLVGSHCLVGQRSGAVEDVPSRCTHDRRLRGAKRLLF